jgi:hypothetical protein
MDHEDTRRYINGTCVTVFYLSQKVHFSWKIQPFEKEPVGNILIATVFIYNIFYICNVLKAILDCMLQTQNFRFLQSFGLPLIFRYGVHLWSV